MQKTYLAAVFMLLAAPALAQDIATETTTLGASAITLHVQPFLDATELATLRLVASNKDALALFVPNSQSFAAMAAAPEEGFIKDGAPVASAKALSDLPDAAAAATAALDACNSARSTTPPCVLLPEIGPKN